jgi:hypothetical protein
MYVNNTKRQLVSRSAQSFRAMNGCGCDAGMGDLGGFWGWLGRFLHITPRYQPRRLDW